MIKNPILTPQKTRRLSPRQYLDEMRKHNIANNIDSVTFIPPKPGSNGYGSFQVTYKMPILVAR